MNKLRGEHEIKLDADEIALIFQSDKLDNLAELIATERESLENILTKHKGIQFQHEDNFDVDKALEDLVPETKLGDIWQLGQHRIICADCTDKRSIDRLLEDKQAPLLLTDPPYGNLQIFDKDGKVGGDNVAKAKEYTPYKGSGDFELQPVLDTISGKYKHAVIFGGNYFTNILEPRTSWIIWDKRAGEHSWFSDCELAWTDLPIPMKIFSYVWQGMIREGPKVQRQHPTQKPVALFTWILNNWTEQQDIIFDPFLGSGSTLIACEQTNRICYGVEIDCHYVDVCVKRWEAFTGKKAEKVIHSDN
jgi:DNA modification methylase